MNPRSRASVLSFCLLAVAGAATAARAADPRAAPAAPPEGVLPVPDSIIARDVPQLSRARSEDLRPYENIRTAGLSAWHPGQRQMLILTRFAEAAQLHEVKMPLGDRTQLTFYGDAVGEGHYRPGNPNQIVFSLNQGGAENLQFLLLERQSGRVQRFTDGVHRYQTPLWSHQGKLLAYVSNARNGRDGDLYVADPGAPGSERRVAQLDGSWAALDWSADDRRLLIQEEISINESYLWAVDVASGERTPLTPRRPGPAVAYHGGRWANDGRSVYTTTDRDSEFLRLVRLDPESAAQTVLSGDVPWDVESFDVSSDGALLAYFVNEEGVSKLRLADARTGKPLPAPQLPAGVAGRPLFRPGSHEVGFSLSWARCPSDVYSYDPGSAHLERWTASETGGLDTESFVLPQLVRYPTFDRDAAGARRTTPVFVYRPPAERWKGRRPVLISIHGGPEGQARPDFLGSTNYYVNELGVAVLDPNVRGSSGYGKSYLLLDNGMKREDSVKDIGALLDWIATQPDLDANRVMVSGGSYGGYMTLAVMTFYSDRLACGYDAVGISNFVTFLEHTQSYRRDLRRAEYGDERKPEMRAFLLDISPLRHADRIKKPLLVAAGANDPRVPVSESDQIATAVRTNGVPVWYVVGKDEGHGFRKKSNTDYLRMVTIEFMRRYLLPPGEVQKEAASGM
ncbi:MAG: prolyl oligopeptidase family serine peptidase [Acidobacteriota bacterium]|nr:prolyl oligopeptidase family serine peptidase [Acidobacteriota bacterium]